MYAAFNNRFYLLRRISLVLFLTAGATGLWAQTASENTPPAALSELSFEQLSQIQVTTASKRSESLANTAAAVTVLTGDEIHRLGADTIPEALRGITGLHVSQINGSSWGVGARCFSSQFAAKLLVMIDGRSVYTPVFGGVFWDAQDTLLDDIDRVEVVLGSGGSLWGANAVNGVINILTRNTRDTQGELAYASVDDSGCPSFGTRYGWRMGRETFARVYVKYRSTPTTVLPTGEPAGDATEFFQGGLRMDGTSGGSAHWTLQGDAYRGWNDFRVTLPTLNAPPTYKITDTGGEVIEGGNVLGRWETTFASGSTLRWQAWLDQNERTGPIFDVRVRTADLEMQHSLAATERQQIDWGLSARSTCINTHDRWIAFNPSDASSTLESIFAQDRIALMPDMLAFTAGVKLEHSSNSGTELQPSLKLTWLPSPKNTLWAGWARAVRTPAYTELANQTDVAVIPGSGLPTAVRGLGNPSLNAERLSTYDAGWRWHPSEAFNLTLTGFLNDYTELIKVTGATPYVQTTPVLAVILPLPQDNGMEGRAYGAELTARWQVRKNWRLDLGYAHNHVSLWANTPDPFNYTGASRGSPRNTASLTSSLDLFRQWELLVAARYVDEIPKQQIPAYVECDLRIAWHPCTGWEIALAGNNLLDNQHPEQKPSLAGPATEIPRSFYLTAAWKH
jgi:iron complex outermembrane receptor protein